MLSPGAGEPTARTVGLDIAAVVMQARADIGQDILQPAMRRLVFEKPNMRGVENGNQGPVVVHPKLLYLTTRRRRTAFHFPSRAAGTIFHVTGTDNERLSGTAKRLFRVLSRTEGEQQPRLVRGQQAALSRQRAGPLERVRLHHSAACQKDIEAFRL